MDLPWKSCDDHSLGYRISAIAAFGVFLRSFANYQTWANSVTAMAMSGVHNVEGLDRNLFSVHAVARNKRGHGCVAFSNAPKNRTQKGLLTELFKNSGTTATSFATMACRSRITSSNSLFCSFSRWPTSARSCFRFLEFDFQ